MGYIYYIDCFRGPLCVSEILEKSSVVFQNVYFSGRFPVVYWVKNNYYSSFLLEFWTLPLTPLCSISVIGVTQTGGHLRSYFSLVCSFLLFFYIIIFKFPPPQRILSFSSVTLPIHPNPGPYYFLPKVLPLVRT